MKLIFESLESSKYFKGPGTYSIYAFRGQYTPYDDYEYSDEDELYTDIYLKSAEDLDNIIMRIEGRDGFIFSKAILHESEKRINESIDDKKYNLLLAIDADIRDSMNNDNLSVDDVFEVLKQVIQTDYLQRYDSETSRRVPINLKY